MTAWFFTWLWQGMAITLAACIAGRLLPRSTGAGRHVMWWCALVALAWLGWSTFPPETAVATAAVNVAGVDPPLEPLFYIPTAPTMLLTSLVGIWLAMVLIRLVQLVPDLQRVYALRDQCAPFPSDREAELPLWLSVKHSGRQVELMVCDQLSSATLVGLHRPCIALPSTTVASLTSSELDQIVLHEYAHLRRYDDWTRLAQALLQPVLWIHPTTAFIGRSLNLEREIACDEWVTTRTGQPREDASCLVRAAEIRSSRAGIPTLAPTLFARQVDLVSRIDRVLASRRRAPRYLTMATAVASACLVLALSVQLRSVSLVGELAIIGLPAVGVAQDPPMAAVARIPALPDVREIFRTRSIASRPFKQADVPAAVTAVRPVEPAQAESQEVSMALISLSSRPVAAVYRSAEQLPREKAARPNGWRRAGDAGAQIGTAAQRVSLGIAGAFTRAGVALAEKF